MCFICQNEPATQRWWPCHICVCHVCDGCWEAWGQWILAHPYTGSGRLPNTKEAGERVRLFLEERRGSWIA